MYLHTLINLSKLSPSVTVITDSASSARTEAASASATHSSNPAAERPLAMLCAVQQILHTGWHTKQMPNGALSPAMYSVYGGASG